MKKLFILFTMFVLAVSLAACGGGTGNGETAQDDNSGAQVQKEDPAASAKSLIDWMREGEYYMKYTAEAEFDGQVSTMEGEMAAADGKLASSTEMMINGQEVVSRVISADGVTRIVNDTTKTIMKSPIDISEVNKEVADFSKIEKVGSGTGEIKGKNLPYDEYKAEEFTVKFYMDGGKVYAIESEGEGARSVMLIEQAAKSAPKGFFDLPEGYTEIGF